MKLFLAILTFVLATLLCATCTVKNIQFNQNCSGHLKRAADANTIELAKVELKQAIDYMFAKALVTGYTSIIYKTPDEDVSFWYNNIKSSYNELNSLSVNVTPLERSNMLMKLRETLLDNTKESQKVTYPTGIQLFPNNLSWAILNTLQMILWGITAILFVNYFEDF